MKCQGTFIFKTLSHRDAGVFKDANGNDVKYPSAYILKVDEISEKGDINERKFKIDEKNTMLINSLQSLEAYQKISLDFEVTLFTSRISLELIDVSVYTDYDEN